MREVRLCVCYAVLSRAAVINILGRNLSSWEEKTAPAEHKSQRRKKTVKHDSWVSAQRRVQRFYLHFAFLSKWFTGVRVVRCDA